jgi:hypothetical protein
MAEATPTQLVQIGRELRNPELNTNACMLMMKLIQSRKVFAKENAEVLFDNLRV